MEPQCDYCQKEKIIFKKDVVHTGTLSRLDDKKINDIDLDAYEYPLGVFIDPRGYLRMANLDDCNCLDHGDRIRILFCPFCGKKMWGVA